MDSAILELGEHAVTPWNLIGYLGVLVFGGRWLVQLIASRLAGRPVLPRVFWYMSIAGSMLLLGYFLFGIRDPVGILANLFPIFIAGYNLVIDTRNRRTRESLLGAAHTEDSVR